MTDRTRLHLSLRPLLAAGLAALACLLGAGSCRTAGPQTASRPPQPVEPGPKHIEVGSQEDAYLKALLNLEPEEMSSIIAESASWPVLSLMDLGDWGLQPGFTLDGLSSAQLEETLKRGNMVDRTKAARLLGRLGAHEAVDSLVAALADDTPIVRYAAASALGDLRERAAVDALVNLLGDKGRFPELTTLYAQPPADRQLPDGFPAPFLERGHAQGLGYVAPAAAGALGRIGDARAVPALVEVLRDGACEWRYVAADALGTIGDAAALPPLRELLKELPAAPLREISGKVALPPDVWLSHRVGRVIIQIESKSKTEDELLVDLASQDAIVRYHAVRRLGEMGNELAVPALTNLKEDDTRLQRNATLPTLEWTIGHAATDAIVRIKKRATAERGKQGSKTAAEEPTGGADE